MSTVNTLSIFPPPRVPRISMPNPHVRKPSLKTIKTLVPDSTVVIALQEIRAHDIVEEDERSDRGRSPAPNTQRSTSSPSNMDQGSPDPSTASSAATLVHPSEENGHVPIRSMFPVYNPSVPLDRQTYFPQRPVAAYNPRQMATGLTQLNTSINQTGNDHVNVADVSDFQGSTYSSLKELEKLWDATSQSQSSMTDGSFYLQMGRPADATFTFGPSSDTPFYTITTYDTQEIGITKTCPRKQTLTCDVALSKIEDASHRDESSDGLVSFIFPKMAAMMAMNQSNALAEDYSLSPTDLDEIQDAAIKRAASQEASRLCWNETERRYELEHPAVTRKYRQTDFVSSPLSPQGVSRPSLHITVATSEQDSEDQPIIMVTFPGIAQTNSAGAGISSPSDVELRSEVHLASLDYNTGTLHIEANNILKIMPSLFAIDSVFAAIATVTIADPHANAAMGRMKVTPVDNIKVVRMSRSEPSQPIGTPQGGVFYATIAEREGAEQEAKAKSKSRRKSLKEKARTSKYIESMTEEIDVEAGRKWYKSQEKQQKTKTKQIVIAEFDLDRLTHYQAGARQGQKLPAITVTALTMTVSTFKFAVWLQTMFVKFLCWLLVGITRGLTSEKF